MICGCDEVIYVINVIYGWIDDFICLCGDIIKRCRVRFVIEIFREWCWGSRCICKVKVLNFLFGNFCVGIFKYLIVIYKCYSEYYN